MKLKISLFKKGLIISDLKRFWWISVIYTIALFFLLPINHYIQKSTLDTQLAQDWFKRSIRNELSFESGGSQVLLLIAPVIIGVLAFRYIQNGKSASLYHSLPLTRTELYVNSVITCTILFVAPLTVTVLIMFLLNAFSFLSAYYTAALIMTWFLNSLLFGMMFLSMTIFAGMFTGSSIAQIAFVYILNVLPVFLAEFIRIHLSQLLFGFDNYSDISFFRLMPMIMLYRNIYDQYTNVTIIFFIVLTIVLFAGALLAFKLRKPETAGDIITFRPIKPLFIYGVTVCGTLLGGAYLGIIRQSFSSLPFLIFLYFICSLISYVVVQMVTNKSFKVFHTWKGYIGFVLVLSVLLLTVKFDIFGYVNKIPAPADVKEAYVGYNIRLFKGDVVTTNTMMYDTNDLTIYKEPENIERVTKLHKLVLENRSSNGYFNYIAYELKNGKKIIRHYNIDDDLYASALGPIYESSEYKNNRFPILHQEADGLKYIEIRDDRINRNPVIVSDKAKLDEFKETIRKDINNLNYQELIVQSPRTLFINIIDNEDKSISYEIRRSYKNTIEWLKKEGLYDKVVLKPEEIKLVTLENLVYDADYDGKSAPAVQKKVEITDKALIQELLDLSFTMDYRNKSINYNVTFSKDKYNALYGYSLNFNEKVSSKLQSYIDQIK